MGLWARFGGRNVLRVQRHAAQKSLLVVDLMAPVTVAKEGVMRADAAVGTADQFAMFDRETALAEALKSLCDSVRVCLNPRLRSPSAVITAGEARRLQSLFELSRYFQQLVEDTTRHAPTMKEN